MRLRTLNGAPLREHLDFSEEALLEYVANDLEFSKSLYQQKPPPSASESQEVIRIKWRHLEARNARLHSGWSQPYIPKGGVYSQAPEFTYSFVPNADGSFDSVKQTPLWNDETTHSFTFAEDPTEVDGFIEHSILLHDNLVSSQIAGDASGLHVEEDENTINSSSFLSTFFDTVSTQASESQGANDPAVLQLPPKLAVSTLKSIPSANYLRSIIPQTPTPTFLCVLTEPVEQRQVSIRRTGNYMNLYEMTLADHTSSGFKVTFWFPVNQKLGPAQETLRKTLDDIKVGDILLLRNVVLHMYMDKVSGQALNPHITRAKTTIEILSKADGSAGYKHILPVAVDEHFIKVKKWAKSHIVPDFGGARKSKGGPEKGGILLKKALKTPARDQDDIPPDTMESF